MTVMKIQGHALLKVTLTGVALQPATSSAIDLDYYTYNGFDQMVAAFQRLSLIFNDNEYLYLIFIAIILGIVFGAMAAGAKALANNGSSFSLSWILLVLFGVMIFKATVIPKGTIHIYDPVRNAYQPVGGVPDLIILVAGGMNKAERIVAELVDNGAASPYEDNAGGISFQMLLNAMNDYNGGFEDFYLRKSVKRYYMDCSQMALVQPSYNFDLNMLRSGTSSLFDTLSELRSPADFTEWYDTANKGGVLRSCQDAWNNHLQPSLSNTTLYEPMLHSICSKSGFNTADPVQLARCMSLIGDQNISVYNTAGDYVHFLRNASLAMAIAAALQDQNPDVGLRALTNRSVLTEGIGIAQTANEWLPTVRATVTSIVLGLFPLLIVFLVTPLMGKSLMAMFGLLAWLTFWGISDAVMHRGAMDQALSAVEEIQRHNMGLTAMMLTPEVATKALAIFGQARSMGATIASMLAAMLIGFSGYALSQVAGSFQNRLERSGADAADKSLTPEGQGKSLLDSAQGFGTGLNMSSMGFENYAKGAAVSTGTPISAAQQYLESTSAMGLGTSSAISAKGAAQAGSEFGALQALQGTTAKGGGDPLSSTDLFTAASEIMNLEQAGRYGDARGKAEAMGDAGFASPEDFHAYVSGMQTLMSGADTRTHAGNTHVFRDINAQRGGPEMTMEEASMQYSGVRLASITGDVQAFGNSEAAVRHMHNNRALSDHHLAGRMGAAHEMGVDPGALAEAGGKMQAAMESGDADLLSALSVGEVAMGALSNRMMATKDGVALNNVMREEGLVSGTARLARNENLMRHANSETLESLAQVTGMPIERMAQAQAGANRSFGFDGENTDQLVQSDVLTPSQAEMVSDGGVATVSLAPSGQGVTASRVQSGGSASIDESTSVSMGSSFGGAAGASKLLMNPDNEEKLEQALRATDGDPAARDALKMEMSNYLGQIQSSDVTRSQARSAEAHFAAEGGFQLPGFLDRILKGSVSLGGSASVSGSTADRTAYNANYGLVDKVFDDTHSQAMQDVSRIAGERVSAGQEVSVEDREDILFDRHASHLNQSLGELVVDLKSEHSKRMADSEDMDSLSATTEEKKVDQPSEPSESVGPPGRNYPRY